MLVLTRFRHALRGLTLASRGGEISGHLVLAVLVVALGVFVCLSVSEWLSVIFAIGLVLTAETMNSALEMFGNAVAVHHHPGIGRAKDIAAGAVLVASLTAGVVGLVVFLPPLLLGTAGSCHL